MHAIVEDVFYDRAASPRALVFGDDPARRARLARLIAVRGGSVAGEAAVADAPARLDAQAIAHIVVIDAGAAGPALDALLDRVAAGGAARRFEALVLSSGAALDRTAALLGIEGVTLVDAADLESGLFAASLDALLAPPVAGVAEEGGEERRRRLVALGEDAARIARALAAMAIEPDGDGPAIAADPAVELAFLRAHIRLRRLRERCFDTALFADPAWDMLLDLRLAALEGRRVSVSSLCIAAAVPPTTALRWIGAMTARGLLVRAADPDDGRRFFMQLGPAADAAMARFAALALAQAA